MPEVQNYEKMIIGLDGNVYTGKTSILKYARKVNRMNTINEYIPFPGIENSLHCSIEAQYHYFDQDKYRIQEISKIQYNKIIVDRTFLSILANTYAQYKLGHFDMRAHVFEILNKKLLYQEILLPDVYIHLKKIYSDIVHDFQVGENGVNRKGTSKILIDCMYCHYIDEFLSNFQNLYTRNCYTIMFSNVNDAYKKISCIEVTENINNKNMIIDIIREIYGL